MNNEQFSEMINDEWARTKSAFSAAKESMTTCELTSLAYRPVRLKAVEALIEAYILARDERPEPTQLDRLATLCLYEEVTDMNPHKMAHNQYPIMSERQDERRSKVEIPAKDKTLIMNAVDGKTHDIPNRRKRSSYENKFIDKKVRSRNRERKRVYTEFTKVQPVIVVKIGK